jgi:crotonobetainyl-CoA:carnitine CoA-transferase CaiB-like acyl-CoA transferase
VKPHAPLEDVCIVEYAAAGCPLAVRLSLAFAGRVARDLGAEVILVEVANDQLESVPPLIDGQGALARFLNRGKRIEKSATAADASRFLTAIGARADAVLCDVTTFERFHEDLNVIWSIVSLQAGGEAFPQSEFTLMAAGGLLDMVGEPDRSPLRLGGHQLAYAAGLSLYSGLAAALCLRESQRIRDVVRVNLADVAAWLNWKMITLASWSDVPVSRRGNEAEWRTLRCADGWVALVYLEADWPSLRDIVDDPRLREARFDDRAERRRNSGYINHIIEEAFAHLTRAQLRDLALAKRLPLGPVWSPLELENDPQNRAREFLQRTATASGRSLLVPRLPLLWNGKAVGVA